MVKENTTPLQFHVHKNLVCDDHDMFYVSAENMKAMKKIK